MNKINLLSCLLIFILYAFCVLTNIDVFLILWALLAVLGLLFLLVDGIGLNLSNKKTGTFQEVAPEEINRQIELRRQAVFDKSKFTTWICYIGFALFLCLLHTYIFL